MKVEILPDFRNRILLKGKKGAFLLDLEGKDRLSRDEWETFCKEGKFTSWEYLERKIYPPVL
jgi:hypothetical protein